MALLVAMPARATLGPPDPAFTEAQQLFVEGDLKYQAANYLEAVALFEQAYAKAAEIEDATARDNAMTRLLYNLAQSHSKAFDVDGDASHLRQGKDLVAKYLGEEIEANDRTQGELLRDEIEAKLSEFEGGDDAERAAPAPTPVQAAATDKPKLNGLMIGGIVLSSLSAAALGVMTGGLLIGDKAADDYYEGPVRSDRDDADKRGRTANVMAIAGGIAAGVFLSAGVALIVLGKKKRERDVALVPSVGTDGGAVMLQGRF